MMRKLLILMGLLALLSGRADAATPVEQSRLTVAIDVTCEGGTGGYGSGVILNANSVITAAHVVDSLASGQCWASAVTADGEVHPVTVDWLDPLRDIARLHVQKPFKFHRKLKIAKTPELDDDLRLVSGFPTRSRRLGLVEGYFDGSGDILWSGVTEYGNSGSGVWDRRGRLVGIVTNLYPCQNGQFCGGRFQSLWSQRFLLRP